MMVEASSMCFPPHRFDCCWASFASINLRRLRAASRYEVWSWPRAPIPGRCGDDFTMLSARRAPRPHQRRCPGIHPYFQVWRAPAVAARRDGLSSDGKPRSPWSATASMFPIPADLPQSGPPSSLRSGHIRGWKGVVNRLPDSETDSRQAQRKRGGSAPRRRVVSTLSIESGRVAASYAEPPRRVR